MQNWYDAFYPERPDIVAELQAMAAQFQWPSGGARLALEICLDGTGVWMESCQIGRRATLPEFKASCVRQSTRHVQVRGAPKGR